jgi:hypothetical protein
MRQMPWAASLDHLSGLERRVLNDRQVRRVDAAILVFAVRAWHAPSGLRILDHADLVPDDAACIEFVDQHTLDTLRAQPSCKIAAIDTAYLISGAKHLKLAPPFVVRQRNASDLTEGHVILLNSQ